MQKHSFKSKDFVIPAQKLSALAGRKLIFLKDRDGYGEKPWADWFTFLSQKEKINLTTGDAIQESTKESLLQMWILNFAYNEPYIQFGDDLKLEKIEGSRGKTISDLAAPAIELPNNPPSGSAVIVGRGPSIFAHKHLELLAEYIKKGKYEGAVCSTDGMLIECLKRDIIPEITVTVDGSLLIKKWFDHPLVKKYGEQLKIILPVSVNHEAYRACVENGCKVYWFNPMLDQLTYNESFTRLISMMTRQSIKDKPLVATQCGGNCGTTAWIMAMELLKRAPIALIGIDFGYPEGTKLEETPYFSSFPKDKLFALPHVFVAVYHPFFKTKATFDAVFYHYREGFLSMQNQTWPWYRRYGGTVNCTEGGTLFGPGIKCKPFKTFLDENPK